MSMLYAFDLASILKLVVAGNSDYPAEHYGLKLQGYTMLLLFSELIVQISRLYDIYNAILQNTMD